MALRPIFSVVERTMPRLLFPLVLAFALMAASCQNEPFQVVTPYLEGETGTALVSTKVHPLFGGSSIGSPFRLRQPIPAGSGPSDGT